MITAVILIFAICMDAFAISVSYGISKIKVPFASSIIISLVGTVFLGFSVCLSDIVTEFVSEEVCILLSCILLIIIGIMNIFENTIKAVLKKSKGSKSISFSFLNISFVIDIFLDENAADCDHSQVISTREAFALAVALSIDSLATGFSAGLSGAFNIITLGLCFVIGVISVRLGWYIGSKVNGTSRPKLSWFSGSIVMLTGIIKLVKFYC